MFVRGSDVLQASGAANLMRRLIAQVDSKGWFERMIQKSEGWFGRLGSQVIDD